MAADGLRLPHLGSLTAGVAYLWLFDPHLAVHPSVSPLIQLHEMLRATDAQVAFAAAPSPLIPDVASSGTGKAAGGKAAGGKTAGPTSLTTAAAAAEADIAAESLHHPACVAITARLRAATPSILFRASSWAILHDKLAAHQGRASNTRCDGRRLPNASPVCDQR